MKNYLKLIPLFLLFIFDRSSINAQVTNISGTINIYTQVVSTGGLCSNTLTVSSAQGFTVDDTVLIIQMKGAAIDTSNSVSFGTILNYNDAGNYEFGYISGIAANTITLQSPLQRSYSPSGLVQLVRVPSYVDANITGTLTCQAWNGTTGGVLAFIASGTVTMNADIDVSGRGFRGGAASINYYLTWFTGYYCSSASGRGGEKGEAIADVIATMACGRGPKANGGGGGNDINSGGGGGGNGGAGGHGGNNAFSPSILWGLNGYGLTYNFVSNKINMGGGGGGGHQNNSAGSAGTNGGGIIFMQASSLVGNNHIIYANGLDNIVVAGIDGGGGGGAGGTVLLNIQNYSTLLTVNAKGGKGGDQVYIPQCHGNGGGGGGGAIIFSSASLPAGVSAFTTGGLKGNGQCNNTANDAANGSPGISLFNWQIPNYNFNVTAGPDTTVCSGSQVQLFAAGAITYSWFPTTNLSNPNIANPVATPAVTTNYYVIGTNGSCSDTDSVTITISPAVIANAGQDVTICPNGSIQLNATGGTSYSWAPSAGLSNPNIYNPVASPPSTTQYVVQVSDGICIGYDTIVVTVSASPVVNINGAANICAGDSTVLTASGANSYVWSTSQTSNTISVAPSVTTTYSVTGTDAMGCTATSAFTVVVNPLPTPIITPDGPLAFCDGGSVNLTANGGTSYLWSTAATTASIPVNTSGTYTVTVTDANTCSATTSEIVTVYPLPTPIITPDGPLAFCDGGSVNLTASGGTSYLWSTSANTASIAISTSGTYTVTVTDVNSCSATTSETVTVYPLPTVTLSPPGPLTICGNSTVTLIANSASAASYVWYQNSAVIISETGSYYTTNSPGSYYVVITDANGCTASSNVVVVTLGNSTINVTVTSSLAGSCNANTIFIGYGPQSATLTANSTGAVAYLWSTGATTQSITVTAAGTYSVTVWDSAGCVSPATPESQITIEVIDIRCGHTLQKILFCHVPVGNPANPQTICIAPQSVPSHLALHPGDCVGPCSLYYRIDNPLNGEDNFIIYPNPFNSSFVIHAFNESETYHLNVYDVTGRLIISETNFTGSVEVAETLSKGVYHVEIISGDNVTVLKVVKL